MNQLHVFVLYINEAMIINLIYSLNYDQNVTACDVAIKNTID
jgi:adenosine/AMP kinase